MILEENTIIRKARNKDALEIALLSKTEIEYGFGWGWTEVKIKRKIRERNSNVVVAKNNETLMGFGIMKYGDEKANLDLLAVKPEYRRRKVGSQVVKWLEKVAKTAGVFNVYIQAKERNLTARKFYNSLGYVVIEQVPRLYSHQEDGVVFFRRITTD
jgi:ribosomal-protein-alanine N-acetyltransferase